MNPDENMIANAQLEAEGKTTPAETPAQTVAPSVTPEPPKATKFCSHCGGKIDEKAVVCPLCGCQVEQIASAGATPNIVINNANNNTNTQTQTQVMGGTMFKKPKNKWVALLLCLFLGAFGGHKFYEEKIGMGVLYLFTGGLCFVGVVIDFIALLFKPNPYYV